MNGPIRKNLMNLKIQTNQNSQMNRLNLNCQMNLNYLNYLLNLMTHLSLNFQNFQLARYSFDLTQEEVRILVGESGEDRLYESDGDADAKDRRGVVDGRA